MLAAQRLGDTLAARIRAHTVDYTKSERDVVIELIRDARGPTMRTVVEVREADPESKTRPVVFRIDSFPDGSLASWIWDIRWQRFVKMSGLEGTENFDGTHFHLEDLGFTGLHERRNGSVRGAQRAGRRRSRSTSGPYHHYGRVETRIDRATGLPLRTHIYDGTGARIWEIEFEEVETIGGKPMPTRMRTRNPVTPRALHARVGADRRWAPPPRAGLRPRVPRSRDPPRRRPDPAAGAAGSGAARSEREIGAPLGAHRLPGRTERQPSDAPSRQLSWSR